MNEHDERAGAVAMCAFWAFALLTSVAVLVVAVRTLSRLAVLVGLL